jgi:hypothetical protein
MLISIHLLLDHIIKCHFFTYIDRSSINGFRKVVQKAIQFSRAECPELCNKKCCWHCAVVRWKVSSTMSIPSLYSVLTHSVVAHPTLRLRVIFVPQRTSVCSLAYGVCPHTQDYLRPLLIFIFVLIRNSLEDLSVILLLP